MKAIRRTRKTTGLALGTVMLLISSVILIFLTLTNLSITSLRLTANGRDKAISLSLAEAGVDNAVDEIRLNNSYSGTGGAVTLTDTSGVSAGTYNVQVTAINENLLDVYATGITPNGKVRDVRARVALSGLTIGDGAMLSNGDINVNGSVLVQTEPLNQRNAHLRANRNITGVGSASVDGRVAAAGTVSLGASVISTDTLYPAGQSGAARIAFPTEDTIATWKTQWIADAQAGGTISGITGTATITGPKYIDGDITMNGGDTLTITGSGPIYVNGNVKMSGNSTIFNTSNFIVSGTFTQVGTTLGDPVYLADPKTVHTPPALISLSTDLNTAIRLTGTSTNNQYSVIYAVNGGIDVQGNVQVRGSLIAGGVGATITASGNYTHTYPQNAVTGIKFANAPAVTSWIEM